MAQLCQRKEEFDTLGTQIAIITFGSELGARIWQKETGAPFKILLDPESLAYDAYGLEHSMLRSWDPITILTYIRLILKGRNWRGIQGDSGQLGGNILIDIDGIVQLAYRSHGTTDRPPVDLLLSILNGSATDSEI